MAAHAGRRASDVGGEVSMNSVGANVRVCWKNEELALLHFAAIHVPWSFVGRMRDAAEKNEKNGMMTVELSELKANGKAVFGDDFNEVFRDVFVRRFIPCVNEKFNARGDEKLSKLPEDVSESFRLLVIAELLKAAIKEDCKAHIDRLVRVTPVSGANQPKETAVYQIVQTSIMLRDQPVKGSLQELVTTRAIEILAGGLPDTLNALQDLVQMSSEKGKHEIVCLLFRVTAERAMGIKIPRATANTTEKSASGNNTSTLKGTADHTRIIDARDQYENYDDSNSSAKRRDYGDEERYNRMQSEMRKQQDDMHLEIERLHELRREIAMEREKLEMERMNQNDAINETRRNNATGLMNRTTSNINVTEVQDVSVNREVAMLALQQGLILEKVCKNTSERIVRIAGDHLEWRKPSGRWSEVRKVGRGDVVNIKVVDPTQRTFLLSTRTGLLTLRALNKQSCAQWVAAIESWVKETPGTQANMAMQTSQRRGVNDTTVLNASNLPAAPALGAGPAPRPTSTTRRFSLERLSIGFGVPLIGLTRNRASTRNPNQESVIAKDPNASYMSDRGLPKAPAMKGR